VRKAVTIVFCDLNGSTAMTGQVDAEALRAIMLRYFELMRSCLVRHGGTVEKYIGDAVMAVFGVPVVHEDDALRAVRAAAEMCTAINRLNEELIQEIGLEIAIRIGVNTGEVVAVDAATGDQTFVSGEAVNIAARLEQHAPTGAVLLGDSTYRLVSGAVMADAVPPLTVKGAAQPLRAWRLREVLPDAAPVRRRFDVPLLGREREMKQLALLLDGVRQDRACHICTIFGDPGMGKSRVAHEFAMAARSPGTLVVSGGCSAYGGGTLAPFDTVLAALLEAAGPASLSEMVADAPAVATALAGVLRDGAPGVAIEDTFWAIREAVTAVARGRTVVLILDDLQWASPTALDLIADLADRLHGTAVLFVCLARFELLDARPHWGGGHLGTTSIVLRPLTTGHARRLVANLAEVSPHLSSGEAERVARRAEGNPFFIEQLMAMCQEDQAAGVPATLQAVVAARLDLLPASHLDWLRWAAIVGERFTDSIIAEVAPDVRLTDEDLQLLVRRRFIEPSQTRNGEVVYRFTSSQIRDVTYSALPKRVRAERHVRVARWMATRPDADEDVGAHLEIAVRNRAELGTPGTAVLADEAGGYLDRAGRTALSLGDVQRARALFERALAVAPGRTPTMAALADVLVASGELGAADRLFSELRAAAGPDDPSLAAQGRLQQAVLQLAERGLDHLVEVVEDVLPLFRSTNDHLGLARCWLRLGQASQAHCRFDEAKSRFEQALEHAHSADARMELATTLGGLAYCLWRGPEPTGVALRRCDELVSRLDSLPKVARVAIDCPRAMLLAMRGRCRDGRRILRETQRILDELGQVAAGATVPIFIGNLELLAGDPGAAESALRTSRAAFQKIGDVLMRDAATVDLARAVFQQGRHDEAADLLNSCEHLDDVLLRAEAAYAASLRARILAMAGEPALNPMERAFALTDGMESPQCRGTVLIDAAHVLFRADRWRDGLDAARRARACFVEKEDLVNLDLVESLLAEAERS
jgi:class 3 adenylate cyclase/tetratricopeptide (TPR) repeat protein